MCHIIVENLYRMGTINSHRQQWLCTINPRCYADHNEVRWPCVMKKRLAVEKWLEEATVEDIEEMFDAYIADHNEEN